MSMPNPFDQFDAHAAAPTAAPAAGNPFDQFDHPAAVTGRPMSVAQAQAMGVPVHLDPNSPYSPDAQVMLQSQGMPTTPAAAAAPGRGGFTGNIQEGAMAAAHHLANLPLGMAQLFGHGLGAGADALLPADSSVRQAIDTTNANMDANMAHREQQYQQTVPNSAASYAGAVMGEVAPFVLDAPVKGLQAIGDAAKVLPDASGWLGAASRFGNRVLSGAAQGTTVAAAQPVNNAAAPQAPRTLSSLITENANPAPQGPSYWDAKLGQVGTGAALGGAIPVATGAIGATYGGVKNALANVFTPEAVAANNLGRTLQATPDTLNALTNFSNPVPGVSPTTAQVLGGPRAVMVEKAAANNPAFKEKLVENQNANNAARLSVLQQMAGTDESLQAARDARTAATQPFIDANLSPATPAIRWGNAQAPIQDVLNNPSRMPAQDFAAVQQANKVVQAVKSGAMQEDDGVQALNELGQSVSTQKAQSAFQQASAAINQNMIDPGAILKSIATTRNASSLGQNPTVQKALTQIEGQIKGAQNINGLVPANVMDGIRQNVSRILQANHDPNALIGSQEEAGIAPVKQQITNTLNKNVHGFMDYLAAYAKHSQPINDMQLARGILAPSDAGALNSGGDGVLTLNQVNRGLRASGNARYGLSPQAQAQVEGLQKSLQNESISNSIRSPGSDTNYNAQAQGWLGRQMLGNNLQGTGPGARGLASTLGGAIGYHLGGDMGAGAGIAAGAFINKAANVVNDRIMSAYQQGLMDPATARTMIARYLNQNQAQAPSILQRFPAWQALLSGTVGSRQVPQQAMTTGAP